MALATVERIPTLEHARLAAEALCEALNPGEVLLFGSVANGSQEAGSDLDLVLIFDDLGDYSERRDLVSQAKETIEQATGFYSDVRVTDRPEWKIRTTQCKSTFEAHIAKNAVSLISRLPESSINWQKEIGMAPSDAQQATNSLENSIIALERLFQRLLPSSDESDAFLAVNLKYSKQLRRGRMLEICALSQLVMENSLKALIHALRGPHPDRTHRIGALIAAAASQLPSREAKRIKASLKGLNPKKASVWRETSTYPGDAGIEGNPEDATPEFAERMAWAAVTMTRVCLELIARELGSQTFEVQGSLEVSQCEKEMRLRRELHSEPERKILEGCQMLEERLLSSKVA